MYYKFIEKCKTRSIPTNVYTEVHHILPKHVGGGNSDDNLIRLTYRQHILAHLLLYRKYRRIEDLTAYRLMKSLPVERKSIIGKLIGEQHLQSGHIQALGKRNVETNWINEIKTKESLSRGGKRAGQIAKESGQIYTIATKKSRSAGGITQGNRAKESGQIQKLAKYKGKYVLIAPDGTEYQHAFQMSEALKLPRRICTSRCRQGSGGFSRRLKTPEELASAFDNITDASTEVFTPDTLPKKPPTSDYWWICPKGVKYPTAVELAEAYGITTPMAAGRCRRNNMGFSRQLKSVSTNA